LYRTLGVLPSISDSWYELPKGRKALFTFFIWGLAFTTCFYGTPLFFFSGALLAFVGAATAFREKLTSTVHVIGAMGGILISLLELALNGVWIPAAITISFAALAKILKLKNATWWVEIVAFLSICYGVLILILT
jgi:hypothetical protein